LNVKQLAFMFRYAAQNLWRDRRRTTFAAFCIAAGVATVVALRALGLAIGDTLTSNIRESNHGDITLIKGSSTGFNFARTSGEDGDVTVFTDAQIERVTDWVNERGGEMTLYTQDSTVQVTAIDYQSVGRPQILTSFLIDPATFPPTGDIQALEPEGAPLSNLLGDGNQVVVSSNLAQSQGLAVGDTVRLSGTEEEFTVSGIVSADVETNIRNPFLSFFGFVYLNIWQSEKLQIGTQPNRISIILPEGTDIEAAGNDVTRVIGGDVRIETVPELLQENAEIADFIGRFIVIMGLGALIIGGVGIINTMLVMVGRRTMEIATLKTFGLKGGQIAWLFVIEIFLLGIIGSIAGVILGLLLGGLVNSYGEMFLQQRLAWRIYPEAIGYGLGLGMVTSVVFGMLPVFTATKVRPAVILRPNEMHIPRLGIFQSLLALLLVVIVIGLIAGQIIGDITFGMIGVAVTLLLIGLLICLMWLIVWLVGKIPAFGNVDLRLALRNLTTRRIRTATTLLALSLGMFALSSIAFFGQGAREIMQIQLSQNLGGNVLVFPLAGLFNAQLGQTLLNAQLSSIEGIQYNTRVDNHQVRLELVNGETPQSTNIFRGLDDDDDGGQQNFGEEAGAVGEIGDAKQEFFQSVTVRYTDNPQFTNATLVAGRHLTPEDEGQRVLVVSQATAEEFTLKTGDVLTLRNNRRNVDFEVVGILESASGPFGGGQMYAPPDALSSRPDFSFNILQTEPDKLNNVLLELSENPLIFALDITFIDGLLSRFITQFSAIPTVVGLLSLLAAAVIMANTVSLATMERRQQIGILKTIGLKGKRVLRVMLLENTFIGLLGGLLGLGVSALGVSIMTAFGAGDLIPIPRDAVPTAIALLAASVIIAWVATFLSARPAIGERVTNVLRYE
jgi:putative ABC transport system permease protein